MRMATAVASPRRSESSKLLETLLDINDIAPTAKLNARIAGRILGRLASPVDGPPCRCPFMICLESEALYRSIGGDRSRLKGAELRKLCLAYRFYPITLFHCRCCLERDPTEPHAPISPVGSKELRYYSGTTARFEVAG
jgi:hypothetical protein